MMDAGSRAGPDLTTPAVFDEPHAIYAQLREQGPVHWNDSLRGWVLTRHADVRAALKDARLSVEKLEPFAARVGGDPHSDLQVLARALADWMVFKDPPRHALLRRSMQNAFMARDIPILEPMVERVVDELLEPITPARGERREVDFLDALAHRAPSIVISDLFGLPCDEREQINEWSNTLGAFVLGATNSPTRREEAALACRLLTERFQRLVEEHRGTDIDDFTSLLIRDGAHLTDDEIVHTLTLVLFAGHETTTNLIANGLLTILTTPSLQETLRDDPTRMEPAIEEFLRLEGPVRMVFRIAKTDVEYGGTTIPAGDRLHLVLNAANRDPRVFLEPDSLQFDRRRFQHVSFGPGTHMCLGAPLARLVARIALTKILARFANIELVDQPLAWRQFLITHGLQTLPVTYELA